MKYKTEGCSLEVPDVITVRQQLQYTGTVSFVSENKDRLIAWWEAAKTVIDKWECEAMPDYIDFDIDASEDPEHTKIIGWVASTIWTHMNSLKEIPKK